VENPGFLKALMHFDTFLDSIGQTRPPTLHIAAGAETQHIQTLIADGAVVTAKDEYGVTPLLYAVFYGHVKAAEQLLACGAVANDMFENYQNPTPSDSLRFSENHWSALQVVSYRGFRRMVSTLVEGGPIPSTGSWMARTLLMWRSRVIIIS
jgi:ankyrin repeat protein